MCGSNRELSIHHILGRVSDSGFNSSVLCGDCHSRIGHTREEHQKIFQKAVVVLHSVGFKPGDRDMNFLRDNWEELVSEVTHRWFVSELSTG